METGVVLILVTVLSSIQCWLVAYLYLAIGILYATAQRRKVGQGYSRFEFFIDMIAYPMLWLGKAAGKFFDWIGFPIGF